MKSLYEICILAGILLFLFVLLLCMGRTNRLLAKSVGRRLTRLLLLFLFHIGVGKSAPFLVVDTGVFIISWRLLFLIGLMRISLGWSAAASRGLEIVTMA